jgi:hypothetical protein
MSKKDVYEVVQALYPGAAFDSALPQEWVNRLTKAVDGTGVAWYEVVAGWIYDEKARCFGRPLTYKEVFGRITEVFPDLPEALGESIAAAKAWAMKVEAGEDQ